MKKLYLSILGYNFLLKYRTNFFRQFSVKTGFNFENLGPQGPLIDYFSYDLGRGTSCMLFMGK